MIIAETPRLIIRPFDPTDAADLFRIYSDSETMRFLGSPAASVDEERSNIENHRRSYYDYHGFGLWAVILKSEKRLIGRAGILYQNIEGKTDPELAYLIDRNFCGRGLATQAAMAVIKVAQDVHHFSRMVAVIHPKNVGSIRVATKCGFGFEKELMGYKDFGNVHLYSRQLGKTAFASEN